MAQLNAFIARSFDPQDEERLKPILGFLETFRKVGFICETAEQAEVESVSKKVQRMIGEKDVLIGFFTKRYPVYHLDLRKFESRIQVAFDLLLGRTKPKIWSAPAWVLQESGYALRAEKDLILLRERGVEIFGLQGDLEYIEFDPENPSGVYPKLNEMIHGLLAKASGTEVKTVVAERQEEKVAVPAEPATIETNVQKPKEDTEPNIVAHYLEILEAQENANFDALDRAWNAGKELIKAEKTKFKSLVWDWIYFEKRFEMSATDAIESLKRLRDENPAEAGPRQTLANCFLGAREFGQAASFYLEAAELSKDDQQKGRNLVDAAKAFRQAKQYGAGELVISRAIQVTSGELLGEAIGVQYQLLQDSGKDYFAFATAEDALQANPLHPLRFTLGLDYRRKGLNELGLSHFKFLHERNRKESSYLHNLAFLCDDCELPITSVEHYKSSFALGETLSAANLGYKYLDGGMAAEANDLIEQAMKIEHHDSRVEHCLAEIVRRREAEREKENQLTEATTMKKTFLARMGRASVTTCASISGSWKFPFGIMPLLIVSNRVTGTMEKKSESSGYGDIVTVLSGVGGEKVPRTEKYGFKGRMTGSVCEFDLVIDSGSVLGSIGSNKKIGIRRVLDRRKNCGLRGAIEF